MRVLLVAVVIAVTAACTDDSPTAADPDRQPEFELSNPAERLPYVNSHVYGSFAVQAGGGVIRSGKANFPGHPPIGPGTCEDGLWVNGQGKPTTGSLEKPHPHCFSPAAAVEIVLEPISTCYSGAQDPIDPDNPKPPADPCPPVSTVKGTITTRLLFRELGKLWSEAYVLSSENTTDSKASNTKGVGTIVGYAIDASTLGTTNKRVGLLAIDLTQYSAPLVYLHYNEKAGCDVDEVIESPCLNKVITASYKPLPIEQGGLGEFDPAVEGFLWVTRANSPYNYTD